MTYFFFFLKNSRHSICAVAPAGPAPSHKITRASSAPHATAPSYHQAQPCLLQPHLCITMRNRTSKPCTTMAIAHAGSTIIPLPPCTTTPAGPAPRLWQSEQGTPVQGSVDPPCINSRGRWEQEAMPHIMVVPSPVSASLCCFKSAMIPLRSICWSW